MECVSQFFKKRQKKKSYGLGVKLVLDGFMLFVLTLISSVSLRSFFVRFVNNFFLFFQRVSLPDVGVFIAFAGDFVPSGWSVC